MERDRESIGLTQETQAILAEIEAHGWFLEGQDVARFCLSYAIRAKTEEGSTLEPKPDGPPGTSTRPVRFEPCSRLCTRVARCRCVSWNTWSTKGFEWWGSESGLRLLVLPT